MMFWHAVDHGETVVGHQQLRVFKLLARAAVAAQEREEEPLSEGLAGTQGRGMRRLMKAALPAARAS
jgi:hypothetical protein